MTGNYKLMILPIVATTAILALGGVADGFTNNCNGKAINIHSIHNLNPLTVSRHTSASTKPTPTTLFSDSFDDDELAKLIGKRSQIKRKKKEELPNEDAKFKDMVGDAPLEEDSLDWEKMPEFQTKRPVRESKKSDNEEEDDSIYKRRSDEPPYIDYTYEYEDENELHIPNRIGISTVGWGDASLGFVSSGKLKKQQLREGKYVPGDLQLAFNELLEEGILLFETSPQYGKAMASKKLSAEHILARCMSEHPNAEEVSPLLLDTFANALWQRRSAAVTNSLTASCETLGTSAVEVYQAKNIGWLPSGGIVKGMVEAVIDQGTANYVGVQSIAPLRLRRLISKLEKQGLTVTTNSFDFSLTNRKREAWIQACKTLGVIPMCRDPLGGGLASGQYTATNPSGGLASSGAAKYSFATLEKLQPLHSVLESVAERVKTRLIRENRDIKDRYRGRKGPTPKINTDITPAQIAYNYVVAKGAVPLAEINSPKEAQELIGCLGWTLAEDEVQMLESAADLCKL